MNHIVFFDGECALCHRAVHFLISADQRQQFLFAPLQGETAEARLKQPVPLDSLVLLEQGTRELRYGKAALRICWYLGRWWRLLGLLSFLPSWLADRVYRLVARNRHFFGKSSPQAALPPERLLK